MKYTGRGRLLEFFYDAYCDSKRQSEFAEYEIFYQLKPEMNRNKLNIYLREFLAKGLIEFDKKRKNAYLISDLGIIHYSSSGWSLLSTNQKIKLIGIITASIIAITFGILGLWLM